MIGTTNASIAAQCASRLPTRDLSEELSNWRTNSPFIYDFLAIHVLEWPTLTVEFLPEATSLPSGSLSQKSASQFEVSQVLLVGSHTADYEPNYLELVDVALPEGPLGSESREYLQHEDYAGFGYGGFGEKFRVLRKIAHRHGEPNRARSMPSDRRIIGSISVGGAVTIFDTRNDSRINESTPETQSPTKSGKKLSQLNSERSQFDDSGATVLEEVPTISLEGHDQEGWALSWSFFKDGYLSTGADDCRVCIWDITANLVTGAASSNKLKKSESASKHGAKNLSMAPLTTYEGHEGAVQDIAWNPSHEALLASVGDDGRLILWDIRETSNFVNRIQANNLPLNSLSYNPYKPYILAAGGVDKEVLLWDTRQPRQTLHRMTGHDKQISRLEFSPFAERYLASAGGDRKLLVWDIYSIGKEQSAEDALDGPSELLFTHSGHSSAINDFSWNTNGNFEGMIASVSDDNQLQLWKMGDIMVCDDSQETDEEEDDGFEVE